jgi:hypothetical protein
MTTEEPKNSTDFINKLFSKATDGKRKCLFVTSESGGGCDKKSPIFCFHQFEESTSSSNYAKHLCTHVIKKEGASYKNLERDLRKFYPLVSKKQLRDVVIMPNKRTFTQANCQSAAGPTSSSASQAIDRSVPTSSNTNTDSSSNSNLPGEDQSNKKSRQTTIVEANQNAWNHLFLDKLAVCFASSSWAYLTADQSWCSCSIGRTFCCNWFLVQSTNQSCQ